MPGSFRAGGYQYTDQIISAWPVYYDTPDYANSPLDSWMAADGKLTKIKDMEDSYLFNVLAKVNREPDNTQRHKLVTIEKEVARRLATRLGK